MHKANMDKIRDLFVGIDRKVEVEGKGKIIPINFDNAATTPAFKRVLKRVIECSEMYGSIARGDGQKSQFCSDTYEECRNYIMNYFNAPQNLYTAIFTDNTTMGINRLSNILIKDRDDIVITTRMEHHSNDLPWRGKCNLKYLEVDNNGRVKIDDLEEMLIKYCGKVKYVTISGASNVTGYLNDIRRAAKLAHKYGAHIIVDGAQLAAHKKVSMLGVKSDENIDYLVFSAHKMYAPFGSGAIIGLKEAFNYYPPDILGGGIVYMVRDDGQVYLDTPEKNEPGTPNFFGIVAMAQAMKDMERIGFRTIEENEKYIFSRLLEGMKSINNVHLYGDCENIDDRLGIMVFNIDGMSYEEVGEKLANIRGIAVRQGGFCAHPYTRRLLGINDKDLDDYIGRNGIPGMVRVSLGIYNTEKEVDIFLDTIEYICRRYLPKSK